VPPLNGLRAAILDVDGTLVDSNDAHARAWLEVLHERGLPADYERVRHLIGMGSDKVLPTLTGINADTPTGQHIAARHLAIFKRAYLPYLRALPGTRALALRMRDQGLKLAVASSASSDVLGALLDIAEVRDLVEYVTSNDDADRSKPDPDIVQATLRRTGEPADRAVMIGDTPYDIEAAARAGMPAIALRSGGGWSEQDLAGAVGVYDDPLDLLLNYDDSPLVRGREVLVAARKA
jgi:HAD superfamily hydrolase (TIGR01509 family)